jgi:hypothetical protein
MEYDQPISCVAGRNASKRSAIGFKLSDERSASWALWHCCDLVPPPIPRQNVAMSVDASSFLTDCKIASEQLFVYGSGLFHLSQYALR